MNEPIQLDKDIADFTWSLDAGDTLGYVSDMSFEEFQRGNI